MSTSWLVWSGLSLMALQAGGSCGGTAAPPGLEGPRVSVTVGALDLQDVSRACYRLTVLNGATPEAEVVWQRSEVCSDRFGDGVSGIAYVGPCDASYAANTVRLELEGIWDAGGLITPSSYISPCGLSDVPGALPPCEREVACRENADTPVTFNLTVMRQAGQGFFDTSVNLGAVHCSAKLDCLDAFLHEPSSGQRGPTAVLALACTTGEGTPTWLHLSDLEVSCEDGHTWLAPDGGPGQLGPQSDAVWQLATYRGKEGFGGLDKCYWNVAFGLDLGAEGAARGCHLSARAAVSEGPFEPPGQTPPGTVYPFIRFELSLTDAEGAFACGEHPLNGADGAVATAYTHTAPEHFPWSWACAEEPTVTSSRQLCGGQGGSEAGALVATGGGIAFEHGGELSPIYQLPEGLTVDGCCGNPCPGCQ